MEENKAPKKHEEVNIIIDKKHAKSETPTTGNALYKLGEISQGYDLFQEVHGPGDDQFIPRNDTVIEVKNGDHFYSAQSSLNPGA